MARITSKSCLCSIILLWNLVLSSQGAIFADMHDLPISLNELLAIPESEQTWSDQQDDHRWKQFASLNCHFFDRSEVANRTNAPNYDVATCPSEAEAARKTTDKPTIERPPAVTIHCNTVSPRPVWAAADVFFHANQAMVNESLKTTEMIFNRCYQWMGGFAIESLERTPWTEVGKASVSSVRTLVPSSVRKLVPAVLTSHRSSVLPVENEPAYEVIDDQQSDTESTSPNKSLIVLPGKSQDSYWQYYEDCDRWGVEFTTLLNEAHDKQQMPSEEIQPVASDEPASHIGSPHLLIVQIIASQNLSSWFYSFPLIECQRSEFVHRWLELAQIIPPLADRDELALAKHRPSAETTIPIKTDSPSFQEQLESQIERLSAGWMGVLKDMRAFDDVHLRILSAVSETN